MIPTKKDQKILLRLFSVKKTKNKIWKKESNTKKSSIAKKRISTLLN